MTQQIWDLLVIGSLNTDYLGHGPTLPGPGATLLARGGSLNEAGEFANAAAALATTTIGAQTGLADQAGLQRLLDQSRQLGATIA